MNTEDPKYKLTNVAGGTAAARRDALVGGGPLTTSTAHHLAIARPQKVVVLPTGNCAWSQHYYEYIIIDALELDAALAARDMAWILLPAPSREPFLGCM